MWIIWNYICVVRQERCQYGNMNRRLSDNTLAIVKTGSPAVSPAAVICTAVVVMPKLTGGGGLYGNGSVNFINEITT